MTGTGWLPYGLSVNFCEECGRAKSLRLFDMLTGCKTCDEVITRHRCTKLPPVTDRAPAQDWECPDCWSIWVLVREEEACPDCRAGCGHMVARRRWEVEEGGDRMDAGPRRDPQPFTPFRNAIYQPARPSAVSLPGSCYRAAAGFAVHVRPGCRCPR